jgi:flavin reductase (DIM6/NTAB) family NADH-FMN oxidoreductase RutF
VTDPAAFRSVMGRFATGVTVVTVVGPEGPVGMTANAVCSLSLEPLLLLVCFDRDARTLPIVQASGRFGVNVLGTEEGPELARRFASKHEGKFDEVLHEVHDGIPVLGGAIAWVACDLAELLPGGDHMIGIGAVTAASEREGDPLLWYRGAFRTLA